MDKGINLHKELAMGSKPAVKEATGMAPKHKQAIATKNMKKGGRVKNCMCEGGMYKKGGKVK